MLVAPLVCSNLVLRASVINTIHTIDSGLTYATTVTQHPIGVCHAALLMSSSAGLFECHAEGSHKRRFA